MLLFQLNPHRRMIACLLPAAYMFIYAGILKPTGKMRAQQEMIDAQASISCISISEVIPECIDLFTRVQLAYSICPSLRCQFFKCISYFYPKECIIYPFLGFVYIEFRWHH